MDSAGNLQSGTGAGGRNLSTAEIARFGALAAQWWDRDGPMRPLHRMNPVRVGWIDARVRRHFGGPARVLDLGCGAGIAAEALARAGHEVLGMDASAEAIAAAEDHAAAGGLGSRLGRLTTDPPSAGTPTLTPPAPPLTPPARGDGSPCLPSPLPLREGMGEGSIRTTRAGVSYRLGSAEDLVAEGLRFEVVTALEVIEHVPDPAAFLRLLAALLEPGGLLFVSTLNRTPRALVTAKLGAEYLLRWLPVGTHDWRKFVTPAELGGWARGAGMRLADVSGMAMDPLRGGWRLTRDTGVNYIAMAAR
jgi:2-polyprenyl-6-hydroxyphenyl methylase/3-demethylubiquinone-9 3-methyltransferase